MATKRKVSPRTRTTLADQLRAAILSTGLSEYRLAAEAGIDAGSLSCFMRSERSWTLDTADRVAAYLGLELVGSRFVMNARPVAPQRLPRRAARPSLAAIAEATAPAEAPSSSESDPALPAEG